MGDHTEQMKHHEHEMYDYEQEAAYEKHDPQYMHEEAQEYLYEEEALVEAHQDAHHEAPVEAHHEAHVAAHQEIPVEALYNAAPQVHEEVQHQEAPAEATYEAAPAAATSSPQSACQSAIAQAILGLNIVTFLFCLLQFKFPKKSYKIYYFIHFFMFVKCVLTLYVADVHKKIAELPKILLGSYEGAYLFLAAAVLLLRPWCNLAVVVAIMASVVCDIVVAQRHVFSTVVPDFEAKSFHALDHVAKFAPIVEKIAAGAEIFAILIVPFVAYRFLFVPIYIAFIILRIRGSQISRQHWSKIDEVVSKVVANPSVPPQAAQYYGQFKGIAGRVVA